MWVDVWLSTCSKRAKYSDLLEKGTGQPGSCWMLNETIEFLYWNILIERLSTNVWKIVNLEEQHSMAFLGLASPSQARARNMHRAESVVRLFAVLLHWTWKFVDDMQMICGKHTCISHIPHSEPPPQRLSWQSPSFWLLRWTEIRVRLVSATVSLFVGLSRIIVRFHPIYN